jgi:flagellin
MSVVINTNPSATAASVNLGTSNAMLQKSLSRLSSGTKIVNPADDAGGLAVSMKLSAAVRRTDATNTNVNNAVSFLQTQDGGMKTAGAILDRVSELRTLYDDVTKSSSDKANYDSEFTALRDQLAQISAQKFNGINLYGGGATATLSVTASEDGTQAISINQADLNSAVSNISGQTSLSSIGISTVTNAIQSVATLRASNGAQSSRLQFASEMLTTNRINLEAANSRIIDTDVAAESTKFARYNILVQSGTAMLSQANQSSQVALRLLG